MVSNAENGFMPWHIMVMCGVSYPSCIGYVNIQYLIEDSTELSCIEFLKAIVRFSCVSILTMVGRWIDYLESFKLNTLAGPKLPLFMIIQECWYAILSPTKNSTVSPVWQHIPYTKKRVNIQSSIPVNISVHVSIQFIQLNIYDVRRLKAFHLINTMNMQFGGSSFIVLSINHFNWATLWHGECLGTISQSCKWRLVMFIGCTDNWHWHYILSVICAPLSPYTIVDVINASMKFEQNISWHT